MKRKSIFWGIALICAALILIIDGIGTGLGILNDIPVVRIIIGVLCLSWVVNELYRKNISHIFFPLAFIFILFEGYIARYFGAQSDNIMSNWLVLVCALLLTVGTSLIFKPKCFFKDGKDGNKFLGSSTKYIDCNGFKYQAIENNMGSCEVFFENTDSYLGGGTLNVENNMGSCTIHVPAEWHIVENAENNMGAVKIPSTGNPDGKVLNISGENNMGSLNILII